MSILLQIAIPLFVTFAALTVIAVLRRYIGMEVFVIGLIVLSMAVVPTIVYSQTSSLGVEDSSSVSQPEDQLEIGLVVADQYLLEGLYTQASDILQELLASNDDDQRVLLSVARCFALEGQYAKAIQTYQQMDSQPEELSMVVELYKGTQYGDEVSIHCLETHGVDASGLDLPPPSVAVGMSTLCGISSVPG